jgi:hypothetical protein
VRPNCGKQKKLSDVYDMRHNFASRCLFILHDLIAENAKMPRDERKQHRLTAFGHPFRRNSRGEALPAGACEAGAYAFLIRRHTHCLSPGVALRCTRPVRWDGFIRSRSVRSA